ncbi:adhesion G protein-coupled receptor E3-like [Dasypus novemcinctus]|uniref:adhesion G protein-coupled receptor E3-like n=1 Tax=Dasypus novemcinctus TaxID=9361 RepID=UPI00265F9BC2|nr:adhesion G protein-coupled receptor E3-like [Dasypus novemcinctus]
MARGRCLLLYGLFCFIFFMCIYSSSCQDKCQDTTVCPSRAICTNTKGSYFCTCKPGYVSTSGKKHFNDSGVTCEDKDECQDTTVCPSKAICNNIKGSYFCSCKPGYVSSNGEKRFTDVRLTCNAHNKTKDIFSRYCKGQDQNNSKRICSDLTNLKNGFGYENATPSLQEIANSFDLLTNVTSHLTMKNKEDIAFVATLYLDIVQSAAYKAALKEFTDGKRKIVTQFMVIETQTINGSCKMEERIFELNTGNESMNIDCNIIAGGGTESNKSAVVFISYDSLGSIINGSFVSKGNLSIDEDLDNFSLNSKVVSGTTGSRKDGSPSTPVNFTFQHIQMIGEHQKPLCVYWKETTWSNKDCHAIFYNGTRTVCSCSHLSTFAVLMASVVLKEDFMLTVITYVGLCLSLICLLLAALTFLLCRPIQNTSTSLHLQLSLCLFVAYLLFLAGIDRTESKVLCSIIAGTLHYLYLASFTWMLLEGLHLFLSVRNLKMANYTSASKFKKSCMYPIGYGIPAVIVALSAGFNPHGYSTSKHCWINLHKGFIWSFIGPIAIVILININFYLITLWILRDHVSSLNKEVSKIQNTRMLTVKAIAQLFLLGCSWCLGFFLTEAVKEPFRSVMAYAFTITNVLQGVYIFMVHCLLNQQVRKEYKKWINMLPKVTESESYSLATLTTHTHRMEK